MLTIINNYKTIKLQPRISELSKRPNTKVVGIFFLQILRSNKGAGIDIS
jgi:hypothetical protein